MILKKKIEQSNNFVSTQFFISNNEDIKRLIIFYAVYSVSVTVV